MKAIEMHSMRPRTPWRPRKRVRRDLRKRVDPQLYVPVLRCLCFSMSRIEFKKSGQKVPVNYPGAHPTIIEH